MALNDRGFIDNIKYNELKQAIDNGNSYSIKDTLTSSSKVKLYEFKRDSNVSPDLYKDLYREIISTNNEIELEDIAGEFITKSVYDYNQDLIALTLTTKQNSYYTEIFYYKNYKPNYITTDFFFVLDRILADNNAEKRYYSLWIDEDRFGLLLIDKFDAELLNSNKELELYPKNAHEILTTKELDERMLELKKIGLLDHFKKEEELDLAKLQTYKYIQTANLGLLFSIPDITAGFDTETSNYENPYEEITLELAKISRGNFIPTNIEDDYELDKTSSFSFYLNNKKYEMQLNNISDWLDTSFVSLINDALTDQNVEGQFYFIQEEALGQWAELIFLNKKQYNYLTENNWVKLGLSTNAVEAGREFEDKVFEQYKDQIIMRDGKLVKKDEPFNIPIWAYIVGLIILYRIIASKVAPKFKN